jgi:hypothetical protein
MLEQAKIMTPYQMRETSIFKIKVNTLSKPKKEKALILQLIIMENV